MTLQREYKRLLRALRTIPVDAIAPAIAASESRGDGLWCCVADGLTFVAASGALTETSWCDELEYGQWWRWVRTQPERVHPTYEAALAFVRSRLPPAASTRRY